MIILIAAAALGMSYHFHMKSIDRDLREVDDEDTYYAGAIRGLQIGLVSALIIAGVVIYMLLNLPL